MVLMFSTYTACFCATFYATSHDQVTNYSLWWSFCPFVHSHGGGQVVLQLTIHSQQQLRLAQAQACTWTALLGGSVCPILFTCTNFATLYIIM